MRGARGASDPVDETEVADQQHHDREGGRRREAPFPAMRPEWQRSDDHAGHDGKENQSG